MPVMMRGSNVSVPITCIHNICAQEFKTPARKATHQEKVFMIKYSFKIISLHAGKARTAP